MLTCAASAAIVTDTCFPLLCSGTAVRHLSWRDCWLPPWHDPTLFPETKNPWTGSTYAVCRDRAVMSVLTVAVDSTETEVSLYLEGGSWESTLA